MQNNRKMNLQELKSLGREMSRTNLLYVFRTTYQVKR